MFFWVTPKSHKRKNLGDVGFSKVMNHEFIADTSHDPFRENTSETQKSL